MLSNKAHPALRPETLGRGKQSRREYLQAITSKYETEDEPWNYSHRAGELLRYQMILQTIAEIPLNSRSMVVDIGCSMGQLTQKLIRFSKNIFALDISELAVRKAQSFCGNRTREAQFLVASSGALPFQDGHFDLALVADGLCEWQLSEGEKRKTLVEIHRLLVQGGKAIFTDYLRPKNFDDYIQTIFESPLKIVKIRYLNDRLWYQFEAWFKAMRHWGWAKKILSSLAIAKFLRVASKLFGKYGSRHILIVAEKRSDD